MHVINKPRQTGRTTELVKRAAEAEKNGEICYVVCRNHQHARVIVEIARHLDLQIGFPITYAEFLERRYVGQNIHKFMIDDADALLQSLTPVVIDAVTFESEHEDWGHDDCSVCEGVRK